MKAKPANENSESSRGRAKYYKRIKILKKGGTVMMLTGIFFQLNLDHFHRIDPLFIKVIKVLSRLAAGGPVL
mgnify:CR=1 FL=1